MDRFRQVFMIVVSALVMLAFSAGIVMAAWYTLWIDAAPRPDEMPDVVTDFVSTVNGVLAANLGAILGISISLRGWQRPQQLTDALQWMAAAVYIAALAMAAIFWGLAGFTEDAARVVSILPELTRNGIGITIAILAAVLGVQTGITRAAAVRTGG
ncbi:MAG: hypothetical protein ACREL7_00555 [Longimicrobiales bacterium]